MTSTSSNWSDKHSTSTHQIHTTTGKSKTNHLLSSQPRFSTAEIIQKFPHIQHRYCHKIKISIPWNDKDNLPTPATYYKSIHYFYTLVKKFDPCFQILTWDIVNKQCNTISSIDQLPKTHHELSSYLYNVHMTPSRVRMSMVVTSSYNLVDLVSSQYKGNTYIWKIQFIKIGITERHFNMTHLVKKFRFLSMVNNSCDNP
jgi:hypothetical protein